MRIGKRLIQSLIPNSQILKLSYLNGKPIVRTPKILNKLRVILAKSFKNLSLSVNIFLCTLLQSQVPILQYIKINLMVFSNNLIPLSPPQFQRKNLLLLKKVKICRRKKKWYKVDKFKTKIIYKVII